MLGLAVVSGSAVPVNPLNVTSGNPNSVMLK